MAWATFWAILFANSSGHPGWFISVVFVRKFRGEKTLSEIFFSAETEIQKIGSCSSSAARNASFVIGETSGSGIHFKFKFKFQAF
jgi:hypothetical protein